MKEIQIGGKFGLISLVDDDIYEHLNSFSWTQGHVYPYRSYGPKVSRRTISMHRYIMNAESGVCVDHINFDYFDNRKDNLRLLSKRDSSKNVRIEEVRGVRYLPSNGKYIVLYSPGLKSCIYRIFGVYATFNEAVDIREELFKQRIEKYGRVIGTKLRRK